MAEEKGKGGQAAQRNTEKEQGGDAGMSTLPKKLGPRHKLAAAFLVSGARPREIARQLGWNACTLSHLTRAAAFRSQVESIERELRARVIEATAQRLVGNSQPCPRCGARL